MNTTNFYEPFLITCFFFAYNSIVFLSYYNSKKYTQKQLAHIISCRTSLALFIISFFLNVSFWQSAYLQEQFISYLSTLYFMGYLVFDIVFGTLYYKPYMNILTSYVHHFIYLWISSYALITNNTHIYIMFFIEELPTFVLCLGKCNPQYRKDNLFGYSFFILRILYHSILALLLLNNITTKLLALFPLGMHIYWFSIWFSKYGKTLDF